MKKVKLNEESYEKLKKTLMESTYGNDDLTSFDRSSETEG